MTVLSAAAGKRTPCRRRRIRRRYRDVFAAVARDFRTDVGKVHRLVAAVRGHRLDVARQQVGRIGFQQQTLGGNVPDQVAQMRAAPLVAEPAGDADVEIALEVVAQFFFVAGKAMHDRRTDVALTLSRQARKSACASR
jgi:hypothetical protein